MKISIDLLPPEFRTEELRKAKFYKIQILGVATVMLMVFLAALTLGLRVLQSQNIARISNQLDQTEEKISGLKTTQASLMVLKNRLTAINQYLGTSSKQSEMYKLINKLIPPSVIVSAFTVEKNSQIVFLALVPDVNSLDNMIESFTNKDLSGGKINQVSIDSLSRAREGIYRVSFKVQPK